MSYQLVINLLFLRCLVPTTSVPIPTTALYLSCVKDSMQSSNKLYFRVLFWARKKKKLKIDIYLNHSSTLPISLVLPVHKNHSIDLQSKSLEWFLHNGNTANSRCHLFQILILNDWRHSSPLSQTST